jgi:endonuclease I
MRIRKFVLNLPGPFSYCDCLDQCSNLQLEHALPKSLLKKSLSGKKFLLAEADPHNLFSCCQKINRKKSNLILLEDFSVNQHNGRLTRACLYMNSKYDLELNSEWIHRWRNHSLLYPPESSEYLRNDIISERTGVRNKFIEF